MSADGEVEISLVSTESSEEGSSILTAGSCDKDSESVLIIGASLVTFILLNQKRTSISLMLLFSKI